MNSSYNYVGPDNHKKKRVPLRVRMKPRLIWGFSFAVRCHAIESQYAKISISFYFSMSFAALICGGEILVSSHRNWSFHYLFANFCFVLHIKASVEEFRNVTARRSFANEYRCGRLLFRQTRRDLDTHMLEYTDTLHTPIGSASKHISAKSMRLEVRNAFFFVLLQTRGLAQ